MNENKSTVSVVIATRFRSHFLGHALETLTKQSLSPDEVVIVDNGPCDKTQDVTNQFMKRLPIKYVVEHQKGVAFARNKGIDSSIGEYILFMDDDCYADKYWIENIVKSLNENPDVGCVGGQLFPIMPDNATIVDEFCCDIFSKNEAPIDLSTLR